MDRTMRMIVINVILMILYITGGLTLEHIGYTSPPLFAFYGVCFGSLIAVLNKSK